MTIQKSFLVAIAFVFAALLSAYLFVQGLWGQSKVSGSLSMADRCEDEAVGQPQKVNPNKMLFISCGGFLE